MLHDLARGQRPVAGAAERHQHADHEAQHLADDVHQGELHEAEVPGEVGAELRRDPVEEERRGEHDGQQLEPVVAVESGDRPRGRDDQQGEGEADARVHPEQVALLARGDLLRLDGGGGEAEVAEDLADADDRRDHREQAVVGRREQAREDDDAAQLDGDADRLSADGDGGAAARGAAEARGRLLRGRAHRVVPFLVAIAPS
jgi:hypothetical protein